MIEELLKQKAELDKQIKDARDAERADVIVQITEQMRKYGINKSALNSKLKVAAKYKDPLSDKTWSGRGIKPKWYDKDTAVTL